MLTSLINISIIYHVEVNKCNIEVNNFANCNNDEMIMFWIMANTGCAKKKKDILNLYVKSQIIIYFF